MVMAGAISPLFDGYSIASINIVFDKGREAGGGGGGTGKISNTGYQSFPEGRCTAVDVC